MSLTQSLTNPFPGLRPFRSDEHHLFFGREDQTAALVQLLRENRFLAVVGTSGSGKSSLVRAGMIAELHGGTMTRAGSTWEVMILRPGGNPIENLARALVEADLYDPDDPNTLPRLLATLNRSRFGLVEAMKQCDVFEPETNLLVVVDQFEELFRFRQRGIDSEEAAAAFVNLLLTASQQAECPIYVTITMRSDYLGDCSQIPGLAEAVNDAEYLIPRLGRDQKRDAIEKPIGVGGARISPLLVQRLLNDVGDDPDQLPVLQHALMRMWDVWSTSWSGEGNSAREIDFCDFEAIGGLEAALSNHADEIYASLPDEEHRRVCQRIFKTLTEKGADNRGIRRPTRLKRLEAIAGADRTTVVEVLGAYRRPGVTFLMPGIEQEVDDQTVLDLSHESLMRGWRQLRGWVEEEAQSARIFRRLADTAWLWREGKAGLFRDPDLQIASSWRDAEHPNGHWAEQYGGQFDEAIGFLQTSQQAARAEIEARETAQQRELAQARELAEARQQRLEHEQRATRKLRTMLVGLAAVALVAVTAFVAALVANNRANTLAALAKNAANKAEQNADQAEQNAHEAEQAQQATAAALADVKREKNHAEENLRKTVAAEEEAQQAERRSREFRYATDVQLAARLLADDDANATQIHARLADYDPAENKDPAGKEDLRGFEWHYLNRLVESRAAVIQGFTPTRSASEGKDIDAALSPAGELVTLDGDARLQHWDPATRHEARPALDLKKGRSITDQALSPDGRWVALAIGDQVRLVDALTGEENARTIPAQTRGGLVFSPIGRMLMTVDTGLGWWDAATARPIARQEFQLPAEGRGFLAARGRGVQLVSVSADGLTVAVGGQGDYLDLFSVFKLNRESHEITRLHDKIGRHRSTKRALAISPDGGTVAVSYFFQGAISLFDVASGKPLGLHASAHTASISAIAFSPDGSQLVTAAMDGSVKIWDDFKRLETAKPKSLVGHAKEVDAAAFVSGGRQVLTAGKDKTVRLWNLEQTATSLQQTIAGAIGARARFSPDGTLMAVSGENRRLQLRDGATGEVVAQLPERSDDLATHSVAFSPDNRLLAVGFGGKKDVSFIELWDIDRRERLAVLPAATTIPGFKTDEYHGLVTALAFSPDSQQLVAGFGSLAMLGWGDQGDHPLLVYDVAARRVVRYLRGQRNDCVAVSFSPDGSRLASACYDGTARIWDTATWQELHVLENPETASDQGQRRIYDVAFSPDGKLLSMASAEGNVIIWDATTGEQLETLSAHTNMVLSVAFSPDGHTLASGSVDGTIRLWNRATWRELIQLDPEGSFHALSPAFSPDGSRLLASSSGEEAIMWSVLRAGDESGPTREQLADCLESGVDDFQNRVRLQSENLRLHESLEKLAHERADDAAVQASSSASRANWHASRQEWKSAVEQFDVLKQTPTRSASEEEGVSAEDSSLALRVGLGSPNSPDTWLRTPGLLRIAMALFHEGRPAEGAMLLTGGEKRRADDGNGTRSVDMGMKFGATEYPFKLTHVFRGSPAWHAGLRAGDQLLKFDDVDVAAENVAQLAELLKGHQVRFTVQRAGEEEPEIIELADASHIQDDVTNLLIEDLLAAVSEKLAASPDDPGLLVLRAELAAQSSDFERQVADFTAAIQALSAGGSRENSGDPAVVAEHVRAPGLDLKHLYRRRGTAYVGLKRWQRALDDFAQGMTDEYPDDELLRNQMLAQAEAMLADTSLENVWLDDAPPPGANLGSEPADKPWEFVSGPEHPVFSGEKSTHRQVQGRGQHLFQGVQPGLQIGDDDVLFAYVFLDPKDPPKTVMLQFNDGPGWEHRAYWGEDLIGFGTANTVSRLPMGKLPKAGEWVRLEVDAKKVGLKAGSFINGWAFTQFDGTCYWDRAGTTGLGRSFETPWQTLAAAYRLKDDQQAIDRLVEGHPQWASSIGDLFTQGDKTDWRRAIEIFGEGVGRMAFPGRPVNEPDSGRPGKAILHDAGADNNLLAKRAGAYEQLQDWNAAAADWQRAAGENVEGAKLLADFASRLVQAEQWQVAVAARERAKKIFEATLEADPGDGP
ncbi:MAG TPA: PDZ domain-containing protein [Pirellulales bacterium]|nr:PDZ domain-containing protein [Pirellulales bacterium]